MHDLQSIQCTNKKKTNAQNKYHYKTLGIIPHPLRLINIIILINSSIYHKINKHGDFYCHHEKYGIRQVIYIIQLIVLQPQGQLLTVLKTFFMTLR